MASLGSILNSARSAIQAQQVAVSVSAQNIANAQTEGYSRQRAEMTAAYPQLTPVGSLGTGVQVVGVQRTRDALLDDTYRANAGKSAAYDVRAQVLDQAQTVFSEPSENGISANLDAFWDSWSDLANNPTSSSARSSVREAGSQLATAFNQAAGQLTDIRTGVKSQLTQAVDDVNQAARQIADLNVQIVSAESAGQQAPDLRDARDRLIDQLSKLGSVRTVQANFGSLSVILDGGTLVDGSTVREMSVGGSANNLVVSIGSSQVASPKDGSAIGTMVQLYNTDLPAITRQLDTLANGVATKVNTLHATGKIYADDGTSTGAGDFFAMNPDTTPPSTSASTIALAQGIQDSSGNVAAGSTGTTDNSVALALAALRADNKAIGTDPAARSFGDYFAGFISGVARDVSSAQNSSQAYQTLTTQAENRRQSVSGVSTDEELILLMQHQQAYTAASKLVKVVDEMMQTLLDF
ncbi:MAG TPA: flagellar hook-associated protein FlgK [Longimicrobiaceae bacterium]|nr:flagellar hook-associated protein FlgK [Longimicrobiaceae bacterium]